MIANIYFKPQSMFDIGRLVLSFGKISMNSYNQVLYVELCHVKMVGLDFTCVEVVQTSRHFLLLFKI